MTYDRERELFEAHARASNWPLARREISNRETKADIYECPLVQGSWYSWQARADIARREAGAMREAGLRKAMEIILECPDGTCPVDVFRCVQRELIAALAAAPQGESK